LFFLTDTQVVWYNLFRGDMLRKSDSSTFLAYLEDNSGLAGGYANEIIFPEDTQELQSILKQANSSNTHVTISGAGTGLVGGRIPFGGVIVATDKLNRIIDIKKPKQAGAVSSAIIEPGISIEGLNKEVSRFGLRYLPDPTEKSAFIGGTVATNASGAQGFKYGSTRNRIEKLQIDLAAGQLLEIERGASILKDRLELNVGGGKSINCPLPTYRLPKVKNAAGYYISNGTDLIDLFIGQEGSLGIITQIEVALFPVPKESFSGMVFFDKEIKALHFVDLLKRTTYNARARESKMHIDATAIEFFDQYCLDALRLKYLAIPPDKQAAVYFDQDIFEGSSLDLLENYAKLIVPLNLKTDEVWLAESVKDRDLIATMRYDLPALINERVKRNGFSKISTDIAVNDEKFPELFYFYKRHLKGANIPSCMFGHIGESHLHVNLMPESRADFDRAKELYRGFIQEGIDLGGTISGEHGIGKLKKEYLHLMFGQNSIMEMAKIKYALDPKLILSPGNIFEEKILAELS